MKRITNTRTREYGATFWRMSRIVDIDGRSWRDSVQAAYSDDLRDENRLHCADEIRYARAELAGRIRRAQESNCNSANTGV